MSGEEVKRVLLSKGLKITELAEKIGETVNNTSAMFKVKDFKTGAIERLSSATGIPITEFYGLPPQQTSTALNTGTNHGNIAGRDIALPSQIAELQSVIAQQQKTISELSAAIAKLVK